MPATSDGRGVRRPKAAIDDSLNGDVINCNKKPPAQQRGSTLSSAALSEGVQSNLTQETDAQATSSKKRPSEDVYTKGSKRVKRNRKAEGLPPSYCFQCEEEHPWPDEDGTTHHTRPFKKRRRCKAREPVKEPTTTASEKDQQSPHDTIEAPKDPSFRDALLTEFCEADSDAKRLGKMLSMFSDTRAESERLIAGRAFTAQDSDEQPAASVPQARERDPSVREAMETTPPETDSSDPLATLVSLYNGHNYYTTPTWAAVRYQNPSNTVWPSQPPRRGRGRGSGHSGPNHSSRRSQRPPSHVTAPNAANDAVLRPAASTAAQATDNVAQTGPVRQSQSATQTAQSGRRKRSSHHTSGPAGLTIGRGSHRGHGHGGGASV